MAAPLLKAIANKKFRDFFIKKVIPAIAAIVAFIIFMVLSLILGDDLNKAQAAGSCNSNVQAGSYVPNDPKSTKTNNTVVDIVYAVGKQRGVSDRALLAAFEVALVESPNMTNPASRAVEGSDQYPHDYVAQGDYDSIGVFQQREEGEGRDGKDWGTVAEIMDPAHSAGRFYDSMAVIEAKYPNASAGELSWRVQLPREDLRYKYGVQEARANALIAEAAARAAATPATGPVVGVANETPAPAGSATPNFTGQWVWPADRSKITSGFGMRWGTMHQGTDFGIPIGTPVYAAQGGSVFRSYTSSSYGEVIYMDNGNGLQTRYAHLSERLVQDGANIKAGQVIGKSGNTGDSTGPHLHFEVRRNGTATDAVPFLESNGAVVGTGTAQGSTVCSSVDGSLIDPGVGPMNADDYTPRAQNLRDLTNSKWGCDTGADPCVASIGGYRPPGTGENAVSDHHTGNAVDIMIGPGGFPAGPNKALGDQIAEFYVANAAAVGINYIIWQGQIWEISRGSWKTYTSTNYDVSTATGGHYDHLHISVKTT